jgi:hypothetical protein
VDMDGVSLAPYLRDPKAELSLDAYNETGIWLAEMPGMQAGHLRYPNLMEILEIQSKSTGTLGIKKEYEQVIIDSKDRMILSGRWKLVYLPLNEGVSWRLFDVQNDPSCKSNVLHFWPEVVDGIKVKLLKFVEADRSG